MNKARLRAALRRRGPYANPGRRKRSKIRHFRFNPRPEELLNALRTYEPRGVRMTLGYPEMEMAGTIHKQRFGAQSSQFIVVFDEPMSQEDYEAGMGMQEGRATPIFNQARSWGLKTDRGVLRAIDGEGNLTWFQGPWYYWNIDVESAEKGTLLEWEEPGRALMGGEEYYEGERETGRGTTKAYSGRFMGKSDDAALVELFEPLPFWALPSRQHIAWDAFRPGFTSSAAYFIPENSAYAAAPKCIKEKLGPSKLVSGAIIPAMRALETPLPAAKAIAAIKKCKRGWQPTGAEAPSMVLYFIIPLRWPPTGGDVKRTGLRPMRKEQAEGLELEVFEGAEWLEGLS